MTENCTCSKKVLEKYS